MVRVRFWHGIASDSDVAAVTTRSNNIYVIRLTFKDSISTKIDSLLRHSYFSYRPQLPLVVMSHIPFSSLRSCFLFTSVIHFGSRCYSIRLEAIKSDTYNEKNDFKWKVECPIRAWASTNHRNPIGVVSALPFILPWTYRDGRYSNTWWIDDTDTSVVRIDYTFLRINTITNRSSNHSTL